MQLTCLRLEDYGIPYGYSPVLLASPALIHDAGETGFQIIRDFLSAAAKGFEMAVADSDAAALILQQEGVHPSLDNIEFLCESQRYMCTEYLDSRGTWGRMESRRWDEFVQFLLKNQIVTLRDGAAVSSVEAQDVFTNEFLP